MKKIILAIVTFTFTSLILAMEEKEVCSKETKVCVVYKNNLEISPKKESIFELEIYAEDGEEVELVKVDLWMQMGKHGHGSAPLKVTEINEQVFEVRNAYFVMRGVWQVRVTYKIGKTTETTIISVQVN